MQMWVGEDRFSRNMLCCVMLSYVLCCERLGMVTREKIKELEIGVRRRSMRVGNVNDLK
jgi:hypothetical protein